MILMRSNTCKKKISVKGEPHILVSSIKKGLLLMSETSKQKQDQKTNRSSLYKRALVTQH